MNVNEERDRIKRAAFQAVADFTPYDSGDGYSTPMFDDETLQMALIKVQDAAATLYARIKLVHG